MAVGPMINRRQLDSRRAGRSELQKPRARESSPGGTHDGHYYQPTLIEGVPPDMAAFTEEIFRPVAPITVFSFDEEAIELVNPSEYGLSAAISTSNPWHLLALILRLLTGGESSNQVWCVNGLTLIGAEKCRQRKRSQEATGVDLAVELAGWLGPRISEACPTDGIWHSGCSGRTRPGRARPFFSRWLRSGKGYVTKDGSLPHESTTSTHIKPVALAVGLPGIGWHSFRHTVSAWGKEAGLELEEVKTLMRHENIVTTSDVYGDLGLDAKRRIQQQLVEFVRQQAKDEVAKREVAWLPDTPATIQ